jgi:2-polyprenyl-6-methoxyphenol hydroxylase-like FAD-dependent oxidoreductase
MRAIVVGGGIGGLTAAVALRRAGVEAVVFEKAGELREIGAGISLWANAMKALQKLGLYEAVLAVGKPLRPKGELRSPNGEVFYEVPAAAMEERFGDVTAVVHRADLQKTLHTALGEEVIRLGVEFTGFEQDIGGVVARFAGGREERCDLLIGADGLHSVVRRQLLDDGPPLYAGYVAWRGVAELGDEPFPDGGALETWGRGERFGLVKLGRRRVYWYATKNAPKGEENAGPRSGRKEELLARFGGWHEPIPTIIRVTEDYDIHRDGVYYREPAKRWGESRFTLLGDAAHPMTPDLGQGACQTIEDAVVLARSLNEEGDIEAALRLYEERRADRVAYVVRQSRRLGRVGQLENPLLCRLRDATLRTIPKRVQLSAQLRQMEPVVGYEA